ncbi:MAG: hypothetical protein IT228_07930 [Flavobacteriales bacterium]|nr:hypothetical protein [Flavobacteriales bacterium]
MSHEQEPDPRLERVIRYVEGDLSTAERTAFEADLAADPSLGEDVEVARRTIGGLRTLAEERLRQELKAADADTDAKVGGRRTWWWAAAAVLVVGIGSWWELRDTPERLAEEFTVEEPGLPVLMGGESRMDAIMNAYKQGDLDASRQLIAQALSSSPGNDTLIYFSGIIAFRRSEFREAADVLEQLDATSVFHDRARYHRAIALLRLGEADAARNLLQATTMATDPQLSTRARRLLDRL